LTSLPLLSASVSEEDPCDDDEQEAEEGPAEAGAAEPEEMD
jgi:hypothetical protein